MNQSPQNNSIKGIHLNEEEAEALAIELKNQLKLGESLKKDRRSIKLLIAGLGDTRGLLRRTFAESLGIIGKEAIPELRKALLENENVIVRRAAAKTLKLVGEPEALPYLLHALINDPDTVVQCSSAGAMAIFGEKAVKHLLTVFENPKSTAMQCGLASWGIAFAAAEAKEILKKATKSKNELIRCAAVAALEEQINTLQKKEAQKLLTEAVNDPSINVQTEAIRIIGNLKDKKWSITILTEKLSHSVSEIRKKAALSLMSINDISAIISLDKSIAHEKENDVLEVMKLAKKRIIAMN